MSSAKFRKTGGQEFSVTGTKRSQLRRYHYEATSNIRCIAGVLTGSSINDAVHVATASVADADMIVSWNFRHLVNVLKIKGFNSVNLREGYRFIDIRSPKELIYEEEI